MIAYPVINPIAFSLGPVKVHWYGLMYLLGFLCAYGLAHWRTKRYQLGWTHEQISDLIFFAAMGVILGGRIGYMLFYGGYAFWSAPWILFKIWEGGMSFHGGLLGVIIALMYFAHREKKSFWAVSDFVVPLVPLGLAFGRLGNFINGELFGRATDLPWGMIFPTADNEPRHPSQLYEFGLEGVLLFIVLMIYSSKPRATGRISGLFLIGYALCRFSIEFVREPDIGMGFIAFNWLTMGQLLSLPMFIIGLILWWKKR